jgi:hypothetical protein
MIISRRISSITKIILHHHKRCEKNAFFIGHRHHQLQQMEKKNGTMLKQHGNPEALIAQFWRYTNAAALLTKQSITP